MQGHITTIDGTSVTFAYPSGVKVTLELSPEAIARLSLNDADGRHLRKDVGDVFGSAVVGAHLMIGAEDQRDVCYANGLFADALAGLRGVPQLDLLVATERRRPFSRTSPPQPNPAPAVYAYGA